MRKKICLVCSAGGHLEEIKKIKCLYGEYDYFFISYKDFHTLNLSKKEKFYFIQNPQRKQGLYNPLNLLISFLQSFSIIFREKPDFIISTGAGVAVPVCYAAKIMGKKVIFIASIACVKKLNLSSKLVYFLADLFFVQYPCLAKKYKKAIFGGNLYDFY